MENTNKIKRARLTDAQKTAITDALKARVGNNSVTLAQIAANVGVSVGAVSQQAAKLGLVKKHLPKA
jgi:AcrR family transcriptional regulator